MPIFQHFVNLLFPNLCNACDEALQNTENLVCAKCLIDLPKADIGFSNSQSIANRFLGKIEINEVFSYYKYAKGNRIQQLLHNLKYKNKPEVGLFLGKIFGSDLINNKIDLQLDLLIAVPLHKSKLLIRGFNQSEKIADGLAEALSVPHETNIVIRRKATDTQTQKTRIERYFNVKEVFEVINFDKIIGKHVGLVDDVLTTGATIEVCAKAILDAGAKEVSIFVLAAAV
jgi:ComF family protein